MLEQMIESKNNATENARKGRFLSIVCLVALTTMTGGWTYSLFAKSFGVSDADYEISSLVAPVSVREEAPPPRVEAKPEKSSGPASDKIVLREIFNSQSGTKEPPKDLIGRREVIDASVFDPRMIVKGDYNRIPTNISRETSVDKDACGLCGDTKAAADRNRTEDDDLEKAAIRPKPTPPAAKNVSLGVINSRAVSLVKPEYSAAARQIRAGGEVSVQVTIDEQGNVVSAAALSGHPLLRSSAVDAARRSRFTPTFLSNQPVRATGVIIYRFNP